MMIMTTYEILAELALSTQLWRVIAIPSFIMFHEPAECIYGW